MTTFSRTSRFASIFSLAILAPALVLHAQTTGRGASGNNVASVESADPSGFGSAPAAVPSVPSTRSPQWHETVVPEDKQITAKVTSGVLTVDGLVAKVHLNYEIHHASYIYFFVPGVGTAVVSRVEMYGSTKVHDAIHGNTLAFNVDGHDFELTSQSSLGEGKGKSDMYVRLDTTTLALDRMPMIGFGSTTHAPYVWPLSGAEAKDSQAHFITPPPMPASVLPRTVPSATTSAAK